MHVLVLGATGPSGQAFCHAALREDFVLTIYARNPSKLPQAIAKHGDVTIIKGEFADEDGLKEAAACGAKMFVSFAGPILGQRGTPITDAYRTLFPHLGANAYTHAFVLSTPSHAVPTDHSSIKWYTIITTIKMLARSMYNEILATAEYVSQQTDVKWTLFRVPVLGSWEAKEVKAGTAGDGITGCFLSRQSLAEWMLSALAEPEKWEGKAPLLSDS